MTTKEILIEARDLENHVALAAEQSREGRSSTAAPTWALQLACDINNQFEIGLSHRQLVRLANVIARRAVIAKATGALP